MTRSNHWTIPWGTTLHEVSLIEKFWGSIVLYMVETKWRRVMTRKMGEHQYLLSESRDFAGAKLLLVLKLQMHRSTNTSLHEEQWASSGHQFFFYWQFCWTIPPLYCPGIVRTLNVSSSHLCTTIVTLHNYYHFNPIQLLSLFSRLYKVP